MAGFDQVDPANSCPLCDTSVAQFSEFARGGGLVCKENEKC